VSHDLKLEKICILLINHLTVLSTDSSITIVIVVLVVHILCQSIKTKLTH